MLKDMKAQFSVIPDKRTDLQKCLVHLLGSLRDSEARQYLSEGMLRRVNIVFKSFYKIFEIFPPDRTLKLSTDELDDLCINLHAFFINTAGIFDNLGWVFALEKGIHDDRRKKHRPAGTISRNEIGLFNKEYQKYLAKDLREYLNCEKIKGWYNDYAKNYRDSLAHRIPLYVPPYIINKDDAIEYKRLSNEMLNFQNIDGYQKYIELEDAREKIGSICPIFAHSHNDEGKPAFLHPQLICDVLTIEEISQEYCKHFNTQ